MSPVQAEVLPLLPNIAEPYNPKAPSDGASLAPRDLLVRAKTGTGKTLAFLIPAVEARLKSLSTFANQAVIDSGLPTKKSLEHRAKQSFAEGHVGTLIISPTRELATQIANEATRLCTHHAGMGIHLFTGGVDKFEQKRRFSRGRPDIVVATPGRLRDLLESDPAIARPFRRTQLVSNNSS
jgi:ATP-dependent RNA helicase MSS116